MALLPLLLTAPIILPLAYLIYTAHLGPLSSIPGPLLGKYTDLWRLLSLLRRSPQIDEWELHDQLGPVVRTGPNHVTLSDPSMIPEVFSRQNILRKGDSYLPHDLNVNGQRVQSIFSTRDEALSTSYVKPVSKLYSMGHMIKLEPLFDRSIGALLTHLEERFAAPGKVCVMGDWFKYVAWDVIMEITFGKSMGFMETAKDVEGMLGITNAVMDYTSAVSMMPWLDNVLERNPIIRLGPPGFGPFLSFCTARLTARQTCTDNHDPSKPDMLDGFIEARASDPPQVRDGMLMSYLGANVGAGAHTVAHELCTVIYNLLKNTGSMKKLQAELDRLPSIGSAGTVSWAQCQELPYLEACIQEALRISPSTGVPIERVAGPAGLAVPCPSAPSGQIVLPPGTMVGMNPYVVNRDKGVFGVDAQLWRPERWLKSGDESEAEFQARLSRMKQSLLSFGAGKRACIGRNIALIESSKVVASLLRAFEVEEVDGGTELTIHGGFITRTEGVEVKLRKRR